MPITTQYRMAPRPGYRLSPVLRLVQSRISSVNRLCNFIPAAPNSVRIASAVRPCRPITLPKSSGCVFNSRTVTWEPSTALTCTPSGWSTSALAISAKRSFIASSLRDKLLVGEAMIQAHFLYRPLRIFRSSSAVKIFSHSDDPSREIAVRRQRQTLIARLTLTSRAVLSPVSQNAPLYKSRQRFRPVCRYIFSPLTIIVGRRRAGALILHLFNRTKPKIEATSMVKNRNQGNTSIHGGLQRSQVYCVTIGSQFSGPLIVTL